MTEVPSVDVRLINRPEERPVGAGESSQGPTVAAIANAVANATGRRLRDLPFTAERVKAGADVKTAAAAWTARCRRPRKLGSGDVLLSSEARNETAFAIHRRALLSQSAD